MWSSGLFGLAVGLAAGFGAAYWFVFKNKRTAQLQADLEEHKARFDAYQAQVDEHFVKTSELFQGMTRHYSALHEHLAAGAQALCSDELITHAVAVPDSSPMVEHKSGSPRQAQEAPPQSATPEAGPEPADNAQSGPETAEPKHAGAAETTPDMEDELEMESLAPRPPAPETQIEPGPDAPATDHSDLPPGKRRLH